MAPEVKWRAVGVENTPENSLPGDAESKAAGTPDCSHSVIQFYPDHGWPLVISKSDSIALEVFGILRSRLLKAWEKGMRSVLITSAENGEGKSLIALNSALSLAQLGQKRVLLVDADLRASGITRFLGLHKGPGLSDYLRREKSFEAVIHTTSSRTLFIVPAGRTGERMLPELLEGSLWREFIQLVKEQFDLIIVDSLPVSAPFADLELLLAPCDAFLVAMQIGKTLRASVKRVATCIDRQKFLGVIINNANNIGDYRYGYEHYRESATAGAVNDSCGLHQSTIHPNVPNAPPSLPPSAMCPAPGEPVAASPLASPIATPAKQEAPSGTALFPDEIVKAYMPMSPTPTSSSKPLEPTRASVRTLPDRLHCRRDSKRRPQIDRS